jgi:putative restriction endonuclease
MTKMDWIDVFRKIRVDRATQIPAPHKAILVLVLIDQIEQGVLDPNEIRLTPQLAFQFLAYWEIIAQRGRSVGRVELPFFYLKSDGILQHVAKAGLEAALPAVRPTSVEALNSVIEKAKMPESLFEFLGVGQNRKIARQTLIQGSWFLPGERFALNEMFGISQREAKIESEIVSAEEQTDVRQKGREARFRLTIVPLYRYTCLLCDMKTITPSGLTLVEAAHIHQFAMSKNNDPDNGVALCRNHHWAFDAGLWSMDEKLKIIVAHSLIEEISPFPNMLSNFAGKQLDFSWIAPSFRPNSRHIEWHRHHKFRGK